MNTIKKMLRSVNNADYHILRFDAYGKMLKFKDEDASHKIRYEYAKVYTVFKTDLINKFCSVSWENLNKKYGYIKPAKYVKEWIFGPFDIGDDMLQEETGLRKEHHWMYVYYKIPKVNKEMVEFFDKYSLPFNVKLVKKI